jgi:small subunit ribosomal protein S17
MGGASFVGRVVSNRMQKTVVVAVNYLVWQPKLKVYEKRISKHFAHDEGQACNIGDTVRIKWIPRRSKHKNYNVEEVLRKVRVYSASFGEQQAAAAEAASQEPRPSRVELAEARFAAAQADLQEKQKQLQQLQQLRAAHDQDLSPAHWEASEHNAGSSRSSHDLQQQQQQQQQPQQQQQQQQQQQPDGLEHT